MLIPVTDPDFQARLRAALPARCFPADPDPFLREPRGRWQGQGMVVAPGDTAEVAKVVQICHAHRVGVVPYGGGTGLVCGQIAPAGPAPLILSLARLCHIGQPDTRANAIEAGAGAILFDIQEAARRADRLFALSLASEGSARIGGLLATNAGGLNVLRYGTARAQVLGLEVVTAAGQVWNGLSALHKDNTGYDLRDLMIGAEGTLGVITAATLRLSPRPARRATALLAVAGPEAALDLLSGAQTRAGEGVSAFELMHRQGLDFLAETGLLEAPPITPLPEWMVLIELGVPDSLDPDLMLEELFVAALEAGTAHDGVLARSEADRDRLWALRETIPEANRRIGSLSSHDIALPLGAIPEFVHKAPARLSALGQFRINCFGHLGDGNLHYNVFPPVGGMPDPSVELRDQIKTCVHDLVAEYGGSFSAEHGVGRAKVRDLERYGDPVRLSMMRAIKDALDPHGILNPGAVLRGSAG